MKFNDYMNKLFSDYIFDRIFDNRQNALLENYSDIIEKWDNSFIRLGIPVNLSLFKKEEMDVFNKHYQKQVMKLDDELNQIFDNYLPKVTIENSNKYYYRMHDGDINPSNIVDINTIVFVIKIIVNMNREFASFIEEYASLKKHCGNIESEVSKGKNYKIRILFEM